MLLTQPFIDSDPEIQAYLRSVPPNASPLEQFQQATGPGGLVAKLRARGYELPEGMTLNPKTRRLEADKGGFNPWLAAGTLAGPLAIGVGGMAGKAIGIGGAAAKKGAGAAGQNVPNYNPDEPGTGPTMPANVGGSGSGAGGPATALAILGGLLGGKMLGGGQNSVPPQLSQLLQMGVDRQAAQTPLFNAANSGMHQMLPNFAKQGSGSPTMLASQAPAPPTMQVTGHTPDGGGMPSWLLPLMLGGGLAIPDLVKGNMPYASIIEGFKKLFGGGGGTTQSRDTVSNMGGMPAGSFRNTIPSLSGTEASIPPWDSSWEQPQTNTVPEDILTSRDLPEGF